MKYESSILKRLIDTYGVIGNPRYLSEIIKEFIVRGKELYPHLFTYQSDWLAHIDEFGLTPDYVVSYTGQHIYAPNTKEKPVKSAILKGNTLVNLQPMTSIAYQNSNDGIIVKENNRIICTSKSTTATNIRFNYVVDASKTYTVKCKLFNNSSSDIKFLDHTINVSKPIVAVPSGETSSINFKFKPHSASVNMGVFLFINHGSPRVIDEEVIIEDLIIVEGDYTNQDISYFEGMQSVKMPVLTTSNEDGTKTNILTVNEGVELGSVGEVKDELNLLTQQLTQRTETRPYQEGDELNSEFVTDMANTRYKLAQEVVKTVDLTIHDKDHQKVERLTSFDGGTHFTTSSQDGSLLPTLTVDVVTDLEEALMVCSLEGNTM